MLAMRTRLGVVITDFIWVYLELSLHHFVVHYTDVLQIIFGTIHCSLMRTNTARAERSVC